jgi:nicotinamide riboside transporter PnuC
MGKKQPAKSAAQDAEMPVKIISIQERHRTIRWACTCGLLAVGLWCVKDAIIALYGKPPTVWAAIIAAIGIVATLIMWPPIRWVGKLRAYMKTDRS